LLLLAAQKFGVRSSNLADS